MGKKEGETFVLSNATSAYAYLLNWFSRMHHFGEVRIALTTREDDATWKLMTVLPQGGVFQIYENGTIKDCKGVFGDDNTVYNPDGTPYQE